MELYKWWQWLIIIPLFLSSFVEGNSSHTYDHKSLEAFVSKNVNKIQNPKTGVFYNISLGHNYTGMEITVVRLRTVSFWLRGLNHSFLNVPSHVIPQPNRKRMAIVYENFGNLSSHYYNVPNYTLVAPVFGFLAYTSSENTIIENEKMEFIIQQGNPNITIHFPDHVELHARQHTPICVKFDDGGNVEFKNMTKPFVCEINSPGHYTLVVPSSKELHNKNHSITNRFNIWWVLGFVIGFVGLVLFVIFIVALVKAAERRKLRKMEKNSERGEAFDTFWINGETRLPLATTIRTQPVLEN